MDRFTWAVVTGVIAICVIALGSALILRAGERPPDLSTPEGVALAYASAIQNHEPDRAWDLLASGDAAGLPPGPFGRVEAPPPVSTPPPPPPPAGTPGAPVRIPTPVAPAASRITQEQFRQSVYNSPKQRPGSKRLRITGTTMISDDRARVDMEVSNVPTPDGPRFPFFVFGGSSYGYPVTFEIQRRGNTWRITSAPPIFNFL